MTSDAEKKLKTIRARVDQDDLRRAAIERTRNTSTRPTAADQDSLHRPEYAPSEFERDVADLLDEIYPFCVLPNVRLFGTEDLGSTDMGHEIDGVIHVRKDAVDFLILVEAKKQKIKINEGEWKAIYDDREKDVRQQIKRHVKIIKEYLRPLARRTDLRFICVVASADQPGTHNVTATGDFNVPQHLCSINELPRRLEQIIGGDPKSQEPAGKVLRVEQSLFLNTLRLGLPEPRLGHPELANAVRYVERCRRTLDEALFQYFNPTPERWIIIGTAGMGKSVLLAYVAAVLTSGHKLTSALGETWSIKAPDLLEKLKFDLDPKKGVVAIMAMSEKQLTSIRGWYAFFQERLREGDQIGGVTFRPPAFVLCQDKDSFNGAGNWSALLIDEAHDLPAYAPAIISELNQKGIYTVAAFDPHQRIRQNQQATSYISGLNFSNKYVRLRQVYRNPAPIYIASLALMFRWFATTGPKVVPTPTELTDAFGFHANTIPGDQGTTLSMMSDAHPANSWCHTVALLPDAATAFAILTNERMGRREVLWVRFSTEDRDFDYEKLNRHFTYHNCRIEDADYLSNKYIKGQDYPIVVIEGFPGFMDDYTGLKGAKPEDAERRMWQFRRELYLCASRATCFLYFICNVPENEPVTRIKAELNAIIEATSLPLERHTNGTRSWHFQIRKTESTRTLAALEPTQEEASDRVLDGNVQTPSNLSPAPAPTTKAVFPAPLAPTALPAQTQEKPEVPVASKPVFPGVRPAPLTQSRPSAPSAPTAEKTALPALFSSASPAVRPAAPPPPPPPPTPRIEGGISSRTQVTPTPKPITASPALVQQPLLPVIELRGEITPRILSTALGEMSALVIIKALLEIGVTARHDTVIGTDEAVTVCKMKGFQLTKLP